MKLSPLALSIAAASLCVAQVNAAGINSSTDEAQLTNVMANRFHNPMRYCHRSLT